MNSMSDVRKAASALARVRKLLNSTRAEPQVEAAVPPGEWWLRVQRRRPLPTTAGATAPAAPHAAPRTPLNAGNGAAPHGEPADAARDANGAVARNGASRKRVRRRRASDRMPRVPPAQSDLEPWIPQPGESTCPFPFRPMPDALAAECARGWLGWRLACVVGRHCRCPPELTSNGQCSTKEPNALPFNCDVHALPCSLSQCALQTRLQSPLQSPLCPCRYAATGDLRLHNVTFAYPMRPHAPVLADVDITLRHGEVTALVGRSGAGKSTVAALISRFYTPDVGLITMGGIDVHAWSRTAWSDAVAMVAQEPVLFAATVADNIAYGRPQASRDEVVAAAKAANAHGFIEELEEGCAGSHFDQRRCVV